MLQAMIRRTALHATMVPAAALALAAPAPLPESGAPGATPAPDSGPSPAAPVAIPGRDPPAPGDTVPGEAGERERLIRRARQAQGDFEEFRRARFPRTWGRPVSECDEVIGRFCLWHDDGDGGLEPPEESPEVRAARDRLVAVLDSVRSLLPENGWVTGQEVRYLLEAGRPGEAREVAGTCAAEPWWCAALAGYVEHRAGRYEAAEAAFDSALSAMDGERRCRWTDLSELLRGDLKDRYEETGCPGREELQRRIWWLADPFRLVPGNDRRSEHFARNVLDRLDRDAASPSGVRWGEDLREVLLRYGWPIGWRRDVSERFRASPLRSGGPAVVSYYSDRARRFLPAPEHAERPWQIGPGDWDLEPWHPRSEYAPDYVAHFGRLTSRATSFRRGDSALVVAAYRLEPPPPADGGEWPRGAIPDSLRVEGWVRAGLFLSTGPGGQERRVTTRTSGREGTLILAAPRGPLLLDLEVLSPLDSVAARQRRGLAPGDGPGDGPPALSELLVAAPPTATLGESVPEAAEHAVAEARFEPGARVGLYWEVYGAGRRELRTAVTLREEGGGLLQSIGKLLGLAGGGEGVRAEWTDVPAGGAVHARSLVVRLPPDLPDGDYALRVDVEPAGAAPLSVEARLRVEAGPDRR